MALTPEQQVIALAVEICASVSDANLHRREEYLASTLVNPYVVRELANKLEELYPGMIDKVRREDSRFHSALPKQTVRVKVKTYPSPLGRVTVPDELVTCAACGSTGYHAQTCPQR